MRDGNGSLNNLMKEFEQRRQTFDDDARALVEVRPTGQYANPNSIDELRKLKHKFEGWKKEYKTRLRETKARLKLGNSEMDKSRRKWWGKLSSRVQQ
jgi:myosin-5